MSEDLIPFARRLAVAAGLPKHKLAAWADGWVCGFAHGAGEDNPYRESLRTDLAGAWHSGNLAGDEERATRTLKHAGDARALVADIARSVK